MLSVCMDFKQADEALHAGNLENPSDRRARGRAPPHGSIQILPAQSTLDNGNYWGRIIASTVPQIRLRGFEAR